MNYHENRKIKVLEKKGLPKIRLHDLRHTNATALIAAGINPKVVQERLGHSDMHFTENTYIHVTSTMNREAADAIDHLTLGYFDSKGAKASNE